MSSDGRGFEEVRKLLLCHVSQFERSHEAVEAQNKSHIIAKTIFHMLKQLLLTLLLTVHKEAVVRWRSQNAMYAMTRGRHSLLYDFNV